MINPHELVRGPEAPVKPVRKLSRDEVRQNIQKKIDHVLEQIKKPIRLGGMGIFHELFSLHAETEEIALRDGYHLDLDDNIIGVAPQNMVQDASFEVMSQYGFDPKISKYAKESRANSDGTTKEILNYPSQTIPGLVFQRMRDFYTGTDKTIWVMWLVKDQSPDYRLNWRVLFQWRNSQSSKTA